MAGTRCKLDNCITSFSHIPRMGVFSGTNNLLLTGFMRDNLENKSEAEIEFSSLIQGDL